MLRRDVCKKLEDKPDKKVKMQIVCLRIHWNSTLLSS